MALATLVMLLGATACGSADGGSTADGAKPDGSPIKIGLTVPTGSPIYDSQVSLDGARAAVRAINAAGGIMGHEVVLDFCNNKNDPNASITCARDFVKDKVVATAFNFTLSTNGPAKILSDAGIAQVGPIPFTPAEFDNPTTFMTDTGTVGQLIATYVEAKRQGAKRVTLVRSDAASLQGAEDAVRAAAEALGLEWVDALRISPTTSDWAPVVQRLTNSDVDYVATIFGASALASALTARQQQGATFTMGGTESGLDQNTINKLGPAVDSYIIGSSFLPVLSDDSAASPDMQEFLGDMKAEEDAGNGGAARNRIRGETLRAWVAVKAIADVVNAAKPAEVTNETVLAAFKQAHDIDLGFGTPPWTPTNFVGPKNFERISNDASFVSVVDDGKLKLTSKTPIAPFGERH
ncbi:ABC transporter substrate-binding protein [Parafrankia sp. EUN1f]|uniref:ABC transporter substrate-binding protein n=1 Tax=Parafrankia sp. EUN1f TaxID=102897 RepID=UPI00030B98D0|nr:ABC transporter substrate-binding protein [Parafrankia sp. EUN1f]